MSLTQRVVKSIEERRERILEGKVNCIPSPFKTFRYDFPGTELATYYLLTGAAKASKSKITNYLFVFNNILFAYNHPDLIRLKIFYALLEETAENLTMKFMCYLLYIIDHIRIDIKTLKSIDENRIVKPEIIDLLKTIQYQSILNFFEEHVEWIPDRNPTGIWKVVNNYAIEHGTIHKKKIEGYDKEKFDYYEPKDPDEYVEIVVDHVGKLENERGWDDRQTVNKLSEYMIILRNHYKYIPVIVQQQNDKTINLDALKSNRVRPNQSGLYGSQETARDCDVMMGIFNPMSFELPQYLKYDITKLRDSVRFLEIVLGRDGESNSILPMYFDGATNYFAPLPAYNNTVELNKIYKLIQKNEESISK